MVFEGCLRRLHVSLSELVRTYCVASLLLLLWLPAVQRPCTPTQVKGAMLSFIEVTNNNDEGITLPLTGATKLRGGSGRCQSSTLRTAHTAL